MMYDDVGRRGAATRGVPAQPESFCQDADAVGVANQHGCSSTTRLNKLNTAALANEPCEANWALATEPRMLRSRRINACMPAV